MFSLMVGYDVIFAVAPINAVSITPPGGSAQTISAVSFVKDTTGGSPTEGAYVYSVSSLTLADGDAVVVVYNDGTNTLTKTESYDATPPNVVSSSNWSTVNLVGVTLENSVDYAIVAEPGTNPQTFKAIKGTYSSSTFTPGNGTGDVAGISQANVDLIFGASGNGVTVQGEYYPPQHPTQSDISVHVQSDGWL